jgi:hypothetical protein
MEEDSVLGNNITSFEDAFDYQPLKKGFFANLEDKMFNVMRGKKKVKPQQPVPEQKPVPPGFFSRMRKAKEPVQVTQEQREEQLSVPAINPITGHEIDDSFFEEPVVQKPVSKIKNPFKSLEFSKFNVVLNGVAVAIFAAGVYLLCIELPLRPQLILGILMVSVAGSVITSSR